MVGSHVALSMESLCFIGWKSNDLRHRLLHGLTDKTVGPFLFSPKNTFLLDFEKVFFELLFFIINQDYIYRFLVLGDQVKHLI